jgi:ribose 1,5-bisphosphokinase PhnN
VDDQGDDRYSRAPEPGDVVRICRALNEARARYLLIGGFAVIAHGAGRFTKDVHLLIDDSPENVARVKRALAVLEDNAAGEVDDDDVRTHTVVRVADEIVVDLMGRACGLSYAEASRDAETIERGGVAIALASPSTLIKLKNTARPQDAIDRSFLEGVLEERESRCRR